MTLNNAAAAVALCLLSLGPAVAHAQCAAGGRVPDAGFTKASVSINAGAARVGEPVTLSWSLPHMSRSMAQPAYLMVLLPDASRVDGKGFFALAAGAPNPTGIKFGQDRPRAIVPLHTAFSDDAGEIEVLPYLAGQLVLEWAVVGADRCGEWTAVQGKTGPIAIIGGAPQIVLRDEFSSERPVRIIRAQKGSYRVHVFKDRFEVYDDTTGMLVFRREGHEPTFSPTGRFLVLKTSVGHTYEVVDLISGRVIGRYEINSLSWSHADSFLYYEDMTAAKMQIVRTLHGVRHDPGAIIKTRGELARERLAAGGKDEEPGERQPTEPSVDIEPFGTACARGCHAHELWSIDLSISTGLVVFQDQFHQDQPPQILVYDLAGKKPNALFPNSGGGRGSFRKRFGIEMPGLVRAALEERQRFEEENRHEMPMFAGWKVGDEVSLTTLGDYADEADKKLIVQTGRAVSMQADGRSRPAEKARKVARRGAISADPVDANATASKRVIGAHLDHLPGVSVKGLRAGRDTEALRHIEREIAPLYPANVAKLAVKGIDGHYGRKPFPDPNGKPPKKPIQINLADKGRDLWRFSVNGATYWLTQTVSSDHILHDFHFSMLGKGADGKLRHVDLIKAANDPDGLHPAPVKQSDDDDDDDAESSGPFAQSVMGDFRTDLDRAFGAPSIVTVSGERYLAILSKSVPRLMVFDLAEWRPVCGVPNPIDGADAVSLVVHAAGRHVTQVNSDGAVHVYACPSGANVLNGAYVDDELVVMDRNGYFDGSDDAQGYVEIAIPGLPGRHLLSQFASVLSRPGIAAEVLQGHNAKDAPAIRMPPLLRRVSGAGKQVRLEAFSESGLSYIQLYDEGRALPRLSVSGTSATASLPASSRGALTAIAVDRAGLVSAPLRLSPPNARPKKAGRLSVLAVGVDKYPAMPGANLRFAAADARRIAGAVTRSPLYTKTSQTILTDETAKESSILGSIDRLIADATADDTIVLFFAGHGLIDGQGQLRLALSSTALDQLDTTALSFDALAARLRSSKARVVVLLDVCHAGLSDRAAIATNDAAVARLATDSGASMVVLSASKGRQFSEETAVTAGGRFSLAIERIITSARKTYDTDGNGAIGLEELYRALKAAVVRDTAGRQTPWLSRNLVVGDFDLF